MKRPNKTWPICVMCGGTGISKDRPSFVEVKGKHRCIRCDTQKTNFNLIMELMNISFGGE